MFALLLQKLLVCDISKSMDMIFWRQVNFLFGNKMSIMPKSSFVLVLSTVFAASAAQAGVLDLGIGGANLYSLSNFSASGSDVEGGVLVAGNLTASSYSINDKNKDAYVTHGNSG